MSNGNQDGPNIFVECKDVPGLGERWVLGYGKGTIFHPPATPPVPPTPAVHLSSDHFPPSLMRDVYDLVTGESPDFDSLVDLLDEYAADFANIPNADRDLVIPALAFAAERVVIAGE